MARIAGLMIAVAGLVLAGAARAQVRAVPGGLVVDVAGAEELAGLWPDEAPGAALADWQPAAAADPYLDAVHAAERREGLPFNLLARVIEQESAWRPDAQSAAGAVGIAQIVPRWHPEVDAWEPFAAIDYAAAYLRQNHERFGTWALALAAYNWGPTVLAREGIEAAPGETRDYLARILGDLPGVV